MFKKEKDLDQRTSNNIKNKDLKKLKNDVLKQFPYHSSTGCGLTEESLTVIFPPKCSVSCTKLTSRTLIYSVDDVPYFFDVNGRCDLYPTVFGLWKVPHLMPQVVIHSPVSTFVLRGADLMAPGIYKLDNIAKKDKVSIRVRNNAYPFSVGISDVDTVAEFSSCLTRPRGMAVQVLHMFGDLLWQGVPASIPNSGFSLLTVVTSDGEGDSSEDDDDNNDEVLKEEEGKNDNKEGGNSNIEDGSCESTTMMQIDDSDVNLADLSLVVDENKDVSAVVDNNSLDEDTVLTVKSTSTCTAESRRQVDELLLLHLLRCLKYLIRDRDLPMLVSKLWVIVKKSISVSRIHVPTVDGGCRDDDEEAGNSKLDIDPDIRNSSFLKVSKFFEFVSSSLGVFELEEVSNGVVAVVKVSRLNELYKTWKAVIAVDDPDSFRLEIENYTASKDSSSLVVDNDDENGSNYLPSSSMQAKDIIANVEIGSMIKVIDIFKLNKVLAAEFKDLITESSSGDGRGNNVKGDKFYTGVEIQQLLTRYIKQRALENPLNKREVIISSDNFLYKTLRKDQKLSADKPTQDHSSNVSSQKQNVSKGLLKTNTQNEYGDVMESYDDEWDEVVDEDDCDTTDPLSQYTVVAGVLMPSALSTKPIPNLRGKLNDTEAPPVGESRRSNVPGGWGVAAGEKWKPIELPKEKKKEPVRHPQSNKTFAPHQANSGTRNKSSNEIKKKSLEEELCVATDPIHVNKEVFMKAIKGKLTPYHAIVFPTGECSVHAGMPAKVTVEVEMRKGNKVATVVRGLEVYRLDVNQAARDFQKKFACSTTVNLVPGKVDKREVVLQGNWSVELEKHLEQYYSIQKRFIECKVAKKIKPKKR